MLYEASMLAGCRIYRQAGGGQAQEAAGRRMFVRAYSSTHSAFQVAHRPTARSGGGHVVAHVVGMRSIRRLSASILRKNLAAMYVEGLSVGLS